MLSVAQSVDPGRALLELATIAAGAAACPWALLLRVAGRLARLRGTRGQTSAENSGVLLLVAVIIGALLASGAGEASLTGCRAPSTLYCRGHSSEDPLCTGRTSREPVGDPTADDYGDGLTNEEEAALGTDPGEGKIDGDGMSDTEEFEIGIDRVRAPTR